MDARTIPEKISDFLLRRHGRMYCDSCIQERMGLKWRQQVQLITATLGVTQAFKRELGRCCTCNEDKQVIYAVRVVQYAPARDRVTS
jgi:hypothetical protein